MRNAWAERTPRERWLILIAAVVVVGGFGYTQIWAPWQDELVRLRQAVDTKTADLAWRELDRDTSARSSPPPHSSGSGNSASRMSSCCPRQPAQPGE